MFVTRLRFPPGDSIANILLNIFTKGIRLSLKRIRIRKVKDETRQVEEGEN